MIEDWLEKLLYGLSVALLCWIIFFTGWYIFWGHAEYQAKVALLSKRCGEKGGQLYFPYKSKPVCGARL